MPIILKAAFPDRLGVGTLACWDPAVPCLSVGVTHGRNYGRFLSETGWTFMIETAVASSRPWPVRNAFASCESSLFTTDLSVKT